MNASIERGTLSAEVMVRGRKALVVGGSDDCLAKIARLLFAGADVWVIAEDPIHPSIVALAERGEVRLERRGYEPGDEAGAAVTFVARDLVAVGAVLAKAAEESGTLVSTLDRPEASTFVNPAVAERHGIKLALSSGGRAPGLLRRMREALDKAFENPLLGELVEELSRARARTAREERKTEIDRLLRGFAIEVSFSFPDWLRREGAEKRK